MIVSWGGIEIETGKLIEVKDQFVNYKFLQKKFRCKFEDELISFFDAGKLAQDFVNRKEFMQYVSQINEKDWILHLEPPIDTPDDVIRYIGRYSKRACISEYKITNMEGETISFRYKDNKDRDENGKAIEKVLTLHYREFFPRLLQHVPPAYFRIVRYYGVYSSKGSIPAEYLYNTETEKENQASNWQEKQKERNGEDPLFCKHCQKKKEFVFTIFDMRKRKDRTEKFIVSNEELTERFHKAA